MPANARLVISPVFFIDLSSGSSSFMFLFDRIFFSCLVYVSFFCGRTSRDIFGYKMDSESRP